VRYWLRNDDEFTVTVEYVHSFGTFLCEVYSGLERVAHHEFEMAADCVALASRYVDGHVSSRYVWALASDATAPPLVRPKSPAYTAGCREKVDGLYGGRPRSSGFRPNGVVPGAMGG
jgi:hypothetical protein